MKSYKVIYEANSSLKRLQNHNASLHKHDGSNPDMLAILAIYIVNQKGIIDFVDFNAEKHTNIAFENVRQHLKI